MTEDRDRKTSKGTQGRPSDSLKLLTEIPPCCSSVLMYCVVFGFFH